MFWWILLGAAGRQSKGTEAAAPCHLLASPIMWKWIAQSIRMRFRKIREDKKWRIQNTGQTLYFEQGYMVYHVPIGLLIWTLTGPVQTVILWNQPKQLTRYRPIVQFSDGQIDTLIQVQYSHQMTFSLPRIPCIADRPDIPLTSPEIDTWSIPDAVVSNSLIYSRLIEYF